MAHGTHTRAQGMCTEPVYTLIMHTKRTHTSICAWKFSNSRAPSYEFHHVHMPMWTWTLRNTNMRMILTLCIRSKLMQAPVHYSHTEPRPTNMRTQHQSTHTELQGLGIHRMHTCTCVLRTAHTCSHAHTQNPHWHADLHREPGMSQQESAGVCLVRWVR